MKRLHTGLAACVLALGCGSAAAAGDPVAGKAASETCAACHGPDGNSPVPTFPRLAGQYADYIEKALRDYRDGVRVNAIMIPLAEALTDQQIEDLAAYFSTQTGNLYTIEYED